MIIIHTEERHGYSMKNIKYLALGLMVLTLGGCSSSNKIEDFIPTPTVMPTPIIQDEEEPDERDEVETPIEELDINTLETTSMYIKLSKFGSTLNVRSAPDTSSDIVGHLVHREKIEVVEITEDGWAIFKDKDVLKYVSADFVVEKKPEYLDPPSATPTPIPTPTDPPAQEEEAIEELPGDASNNPSQEYIDGSVEI